MLTMPTTAWRDCNAPRPTLPPIPDICGMLCNPIDVFPARRSRSMPEPTPMPTPTPAPTPDPVKRRWSPLRLSQILREDPTYLLDWFESIRAAGGTPALEPEVVDGQVRAFVLIDRRAAAPALDLDAVREHEGDELAEVA